MTFFAYISPFRGHLLFLMVVILLSKSAAAQSDSLQFHLNTYNQEKAKLAFVLRQGECEQLVTKMQVDFFREIRALDSLLGAEKLATIPEKVRGNKFIIVDAWHVGDTQLHVMYTAKKYITGCAVPFSVERLNWDQFTHFSTAKKEGKIHFEAISSSEYTQIEKLPEATNTQASADLLLSQIERLLRAYSAQVGVNYPEYLAFEKNQNTQDSVDQIVMRTIFIKNCLKKINP